MIVKIKKLYNDVKIPDYAHPGDAGLDLYSRENYTLRDREVHNFKLGFSLEFPTSYVGMIKDKSSIASRGIIMIGQVCDSSFRGEYGVLLLNCSDKPYKIEKGDKIAQLVFLRLGTAKVKVVDQLSKSSRGRGGFGSTGRK